METQPAGPVVPVHAPRQGTSQCLHLTQLQFNFQSSASVWRFLFQSLCVALRWPVWTSAQEQSNVCVDGATVEPDVRGGSPSHYKIVISAPKCQHVGVEAHKARSLSFSVFPPFIKMCIRLLRQSSGARRQLQALHV